MPGYDEWLQDESAYGSLTQLPKWDEQNEQN